MEAEDSRRRAKAEFEATGQTTCHHESVRASRAGILGLSLFAALSVGARPAGARASARLVYILGPGSEPCPGPKALRAAVGMRLGYDPFLDGAEDLVIAEVSRQNDVYRVRVRLVDEHDQPLGSRELTLRADSCSAVIDAMALTISLAIDASFRDDGTPEPASTGAPTAPASAPLETERGAESARPVFEPPPPGDGAPRVRFHAGLVGIAAAGFAPAPNAGIVLLVGGRSRIVSIDLEGRADLPATGASDDPRVRLRSWLVLGSAVPCLHWGLGMVCAVVSAGRLDATAVGVPFPHDASAFWWGLGVRAGAELGRELGLPDALALRIYLEGMASPGPRSLAVGGANVATLSSVSGTVGAGALWRFP